MATYINDDEQTNQLVLDDDEQTDQLALDDESVEWFNNKYPNACCHRCDTKLTGATVVYCGDACETWYCSDCHSEGTDDCDVCSSMNN
jgi:hypothetical protein